MDPSPVLAKALHEQLCLDLKRFRPGQAAHLDRLLGRYPQYFRKRRPAQLSLIEAAAAARFCGFTLAERIQHLRGVIVTPFPVGASILFRRHRLRKTDRPILSEVREFLSWGYQVSLGTENADLQLDLNRRLKSLCSSEPEKKLVLAYASLIFKSLQEEAPILSKGSIAALIRTLTRVVEELPTTRIEQRVAANLVGLGFHLERWIDDLQIRQMLYRCGARVLVFFGFSLDAVWCWSQFLHLAALCGDVTGFEAGRAEMAILIDRRRLASITGWTLSKNALGNPLDGARREQVRSLMVLQAERSLKRLKADSDSWLGGRRNLERGLKGRDCISLDRWVRWAEGLGTDLDFALERVSSADPIPPASGALFQGLKLKPLHRPSYSFQKRLVHWSREVDVNRTGERLILARSDHSQTAHDFVTLLNDLQTLTQRMSPTIATTDAAKLAERLRKATYKLMYETRLNDAVDFFATCLSLLEKLGDLKNLAQGYRAGAYLALDLGRLDVGLMALRRSSNLCLCTSDLNGFGLTIYSQAMFLGVSGDYRVARNLALQCLSLSRRSLCELPAWWIRTVVATACLFLDELPEAVDQVERAEHEFSIDSPHAPEFLSVKAELFSRLGRVSDAASLFTQAQSLLDPSSRFRDLALIGLSKFQHFLRYGQLYEAKQEAKTLLQISSRLERNPIGQQALRTMSLRLLNGGPLNESEIGGIRRQVQYPNLRQP